ncbi:hypothetical protein ADUPG1_012987 [Aduncisulcus paluster]|uniref:Cas12f1-like TNB domain-containing protein n=1 Tax=Aduncisulcus paluster TaxID=2918883 RepID=A0ABQ5K1C6_9EUKA|nr:hypothetical protein ADUPG1_012987 [Aduncisulcus paluster]
MADEYTRWVYTPKFYLSCCDALFADRVPTPSGQTRPKLRKGFPLPLQEKIDECCCCLLKPQATKRGREIKGSLCPLSSSDPKNYGTTHNLSDLIVFWADRMAVSTSKWVKESIPIYKFRLQRYGGDLLKLDGCKNGFSTIREISNQLNEIGQLIGDKKHSSESVAPPVQPDHPIDDQLSLRPKLPPRLPPILPTSKSGMRFFPLSHSLLNAAKNNLFSAYGLRLLRKTLKKCKTKGLVYVLTDGVGARLVMGPKTSDQYKISVSSLISSPAPKQTASLVSSPVSVQAPSTLCLGIDPGRAVIAGTALVLKDEAGGPASEKTEFSVIPKGIRRGENKRNEKQARNRKKLLTLSLNRLNLPQLRTPNTEVLKERLRKEFAVWDSFRQLSEAKFWRRQRFGRDLMLEKKITKYTSDHIKLARKIGANFLLAYGDAGEGYKKAFSASGKGHPATPAVKKVPRIMSHVVKNMGGIFIKVDEYHTSKLCPYCYKKLGTMNPKTRLRKCTDGCHKEGHRDSLAALNIANLGYYEFLGIPRPPEFCYSHQDLHHPRPHPRQRHSSGL